VAIASVRVIETLSPALFWRRVRLPSEYGSRTLTFVIDSMRLADDPLYVQVMSPEVHVVMFLMELMSKVLWVGEEEGLVDVMTCEEVDMDDVVVDGCEDVGNVVERETGPSATTRPAHCPVK